MAVDESLVASVVSETSERMKDPNFVQLSVGNFVETQPQLAAYLSGKSAQIGGAQGVLELAFHAEFLSECLAKSSGRDALPVVSFELLDRASRGDPRALFSEREPALASYVASNIEGGALCTELCRIGLSLVLSLEQTPVK